MPESERGPDVCTLDGREHFMFARFPRPDMAAKVRVRSLYVCPVHDGGAADLEITNPRHNRRR